MPLPDSFKSSAALFREYSIIFSILIYIKAKLKIYFLLTTPLTNCPNSLAEVFFSARTTVTATAIDININSSGWITIIEPTMYPDATAAIIETPEAPMYLIDVRSNQIIERIDELANATSVERAAPRVP